MLTAKLESEWLETQFVLLGVRTDRSPIPFGQELDKIINTNTDLASWARPPAPRSVGTPSAITSYPETPKKKWVGTPPLHAMPLVG